MAAKRITRAKRAALTPAGQKVIDWLEARGLSQSWLVEEINRIRAGLANPARVGSANVRRWLRGKTKISVDDAVLIKLITGLPITVWSQYADQAPMSGPQVRVRSAASAASPV
jgi:hypothetical protein